MLIYIMLSRDFADVIKSPNDLKIGRFFGWVYLNHVSPLNMYLQIGDKPERIEMLERFSS